MQARLRPATNQDREAVQGLVFGVLKEFGLSPDPMCTDVDLRDIEGFYARDGGMFDVLVDDASAIIGTIGLRRVSPATCELRKMYLAKECRGRGYGRLLLEHALKRAAELGFRRAELETATVLERATALYEQYGFKPYEPEHKSCRCDRAYFLELASGS